MNDNLPQNVFYEDKTVPATIRISKFKGENGVEEFHLMVSPNKEGDFDSQLQWVSEAYLQALDKIDLSSETSVFRRFTCSELEENSTTLQKHTLSNPSDNNGDCAVSWVRHILAEPAKISLWAYHINDPDKDLKKSKKTNSLSVTRGELAHHWTAGLSCDHKTGSYNQSKDIFSQYSEILKDEDMTLFNNVVRTWFFVRDIDNNYQGMVTARNEVFEKSGLTADTHYIASTGIAGETKSPKENVLLDSYAIKGLKSSQVQYLKALDYLSPTNIYGVAFERGTAISYQDRKHIFISGTASIDTEGNVLHKGDVVKQLERTIINTEALLNEAGADLSHLCMVMVYLRNSEDYEIIKPHIDRIFKDLPFEITTAPVCRPDWLIEIEGIAISPAKYPNLPSF